MFSLSFLWLDGGQLVPAIYTMLFLCKPEMGFNLGSGMVESAPGKLASGSEVTVAQRKASLCSEVCQDVVPIIQGKSDMASSRAGAGEMERDCGLQETFKRPNHQNMVINLM